MTDTTALTTPNEEFVTHALFSQIMNVMGLKNPSWITRLLFFILGSPIRRMAFMLVELDRNIANNGWCSAVDHFKGYFVDQIDIHGEDTIPKSGPLMVVCNHPAAYDIILLITAIRREDLKILASDIPIVQLFPNISQHDIPVPYDISSRLQTVRSTVQHLKKGGAILLFPRGDVEPDPAVTPGAEDSLTGWSPSIELFLRRVPKTSSVVAIASSVLSPKWFKNPLIRLWKKYEQRQKVAEIFQIASQLLTGKKARSIPMVTFSPPLSIDDLGGEGAPDGVLLNGLIEQAKGLLLKHPHV
jgi:hypothetical protein